MRLAIYFSVTANTISIICLARLGHQYVAVGYGLHPMLAGFIGLVLLMVTAMALRILRKLQQQEQRIKPLIYIQARHLVNMDRINTDRIPNID